MVDNPPDGIDCISQESTVLAMAWSSYHKYAFLNFQLVLVTGGGVLVDWNIKFSNWNLGMTVVFQANSSLSVFFLDGSCLYYPIMLLPNFYVLFLLVCIFYHVFNQHG